MCKSKSSAHACIQFYIVTLNQVKPQKMHLFLYFNSYRCVIKSVMKMMIVTFGQSLNSSQEQKLWNYLQNRDKAIKIIVFTSPPGRINASNSSRFIKCHFHKNDVSS